jgi:hypothetical protein
VTTGKPLGNRGHGKTCASMAYGWRRQQHMTTFNYSASLSSPMLLLAPSPTRRLWGCLPPPPDKGVLLAPQG